MKDKKMWEKTEVSTRNCYNAVSRRIHPCQSIVSCRIVGGKPLLGGRDYLNLYDSDNNRLSDKRVASRGILFASCRECSNFDNDWD